MPRKKNPECIRCATQSIEIAQNKPCWSRQTCHSKRSYYAKHSVNKAKKRSRQRKQRVEVLDVPLFEHQPAPEVLMTFYRDRADGPIHAVEFTVVEDGQTVKRVNPIHLKGVPQLKLRGHIKNVIALLEAQFGHKLTVSQDRQAVSLCPLCQQGKEHD